MMEEIRFLGLHTKATKDAALGRQFQQPNGPTEVVGSSLSGASPYIDIRITPLPTMQIGDLTPISRPSVSSLEGNIPSEVKLKIYDLLGPDLNGGPNSINEIIRGGLQLPDITGSEF